jgi:hypothetical protein
MPYRPPRVGQSPYDAAWRKQRLALLREQPLCRLCLAAGRTVAATVADHIVPLADGGTNATANLQPLCKRCHDAVKTPADVKARVHAEQCVIEVLPVSARSSRQTTVNAIEMRWSLAQRMAWPCAHDLACAACDGVVRASMAGELRVANLTIVTDDLRLARQCASRYRAAVRLRQEGTSDCKGIAWLLAHATSQRALTVDAESGPQQARV